MSIRTSAVLAGASLLGPTLFLAQATQRAQAQALDAPASRPGVVTSAPSLGDWPSFRGWRASGVADGTNPPTTWDVEALFHVRWKTPIPGLGHSSPVVWGDRVFITSAVSLSRDPVLKVGLYGDIQPVADEAEHSWRVYCLSKHTGEIMWERTACQGVPQIKRHPKSTHANASPVTDGRHLVVFFGSEGLYCYDLDGGLLWKKSLGRLDSGYYVFPGAQWGFGSSPIIYKDRVIVQCDVQKGSFLAAVSLHDGEQLWSTPRRDVPTWSTPTVHEGPQRTELIVNGYRHMGAYDPGSGRELWRMSGGGDIPVPTPVVAHGLIFFTSAHGRPAPIYAVRLGATGDISLPEDQTSSEQVAWSRPNRGAYMPTPIVYGDWLYVGDDRGILTCYEAKSGETTYRERLGGSAHAFTASPVAADGRVYFTSEDGEVFVVKTGPEFELLATNSMGEVCMATPAISDGLLLFRTQRHLVAIGE